MKIELLPIRASLRRFPRMIDSVQTVKREGVIAATSRNDDGTYKATIAVQDDVGDGRPIDLRAMSLENYLRNPVVLFSHNAWSELPIARTLKLTWESVGLVADFEFLPGDEKASRVQNAWDQGFLRAASITARPTETGMELIEWSIVAVPADADAVRSVYRSALDAILPATLPATTTHQPATEPDMTEQEIAAIVDRQFAKREEAASLGDTIKGHVRDALTELGLVLPTPAAPTPEGAAPPAPAAVVPTAPAAVVPTATAPVAPAAEGTEGTEAAAPTAEQQIAEQVEARTNALELCRGLLPEGFDTTGKSVKDLYVAAVGQEVENAETRSEDYLQAKLEEIKARRDGVAAQSASGLNVGITPGKPVAPLGAPLSVMGIRRIAAEKGAAA